MKSSSDRHLGHTRAEWEVVRPCFIVTMQLHAAMRCGSRHARPLDRRARSDDHTEGRGFPRPRVSVVLKDGASECHQVPPLWRTAPEVVDVQVVEGKGFETPDPPSGRNLATPSLPQTAPSGIPCPPASTASHPTPLPDVPLSAPPPHADEPCEQKQREGRDLLITNPDSEQAQRDQEKPGQAGDASA